jgi:hypothetical protein
VLITGALLLALASSTPASEESLPTPVLKAVFLYNFTKFTDWPADAIPPAAPIELCIIDAPDVADALKSVANGHAIGDHPLVVRRATLDGGLRGCHLIYASGLDQRGCLALLNAVRGLPVLTITDNEAFAELGGGANLFLDHDRIRFSINVGATQRARVTISSQLLALATIVKDQPIAR